MNESTKEVLDVKRGIKIALKTLVDCFIVIMFVFGAIFVLFPKFSLKINEVLGATKVQEYNYQMIYAKSNNITDLYNLILFEGEQEKYDKELEYINKIIVRSDYDKFCNAMDNANLNAKEDEGFLKYSSNVNAYILGRKVDCMYKLNASNIETYIYKITGTEKVTAYSFANFVDLVYQDKTLTATQKIEKFTLLNELMGESGKMIEELLNEKVSSLKALKIQSDNDNEKLVYNYTLSRIYSARYYFYDILSNNGSVERFNNLKNENLEAYNSIISEMRK